MRQGEANMREGEVGVKRDGLLIQLYAARDVLGPGAAGGNDVPENRLVVGCRAWIRTAVICPLREQVARSPATPGVAALPWRQTAQPMQAGR